MATSTGEDTFDPHVPPEKQKVTYKTKDGKIKTVTKAELQEQMETSEKLMQGLNETWEQKMSRTQEVQKEREKALEELGITVEKNLVGVHTPKKVRMWHVKGTFCVDLLNLFALDATFSELGQWISLLCGESFVQFSLYGFRMKVRASSEI